MKTKSCLICIQKFSYIRKTKKFCSESCLRKNYYRKYTEKIKARVKNHAYTRSERRKVIRQLWLEKHREAQLEVHRLNEIKRRARKILGGPELTESQWEELKRQFNYSCVSCNKKEPGIKLEKDHIIPVVKKGINSYDNIQPLCAKCNKHKGTQIIDYRKESALA